MYFAGEIHIQELMKAIRIVRRRTQGLETLGESESHSVMSDPLRPHGLYGPWNSPGQNPGVGILLLQEIFPTQGLNPGLLHCRQTLYQLSHKGSPETLGSIMLQCLCKTLMETQAFISIEHTKRERSFLGLCPCQDAF